MRIPAWARLAILLGFLKLGGVTGAFLLLQMAIPADLVNPFGVPPVFNYLQLGVYGCAALFLIAAGRSDPRAVWLGGFFVCVADSYCGRPTYLLILNGNGLLADTGYVCNALRLDLLMPLFFWHFVRDFPQAPIPTRLRRLIDTAIRISAAMGLSFIAFYIVHSCLLAITDAGATPTAEALADKPLYGFCTGIEFLLIAAALPVMAYKARLASGEERRRVRLFNTCLQLGLWPVIVYLLCELLIPGYMPYMARHLEIARPMSVSGCLNS